AGGNEVLASLYFDAAHIDAVELNPVTYRFVTGKFADYDGHFTDNPRVNYVIDEGRGYLARSDRKYGLIWYPAPDSYSATNAATSGANVLSESYLYTREAITDSFDHLQPGGTLAAQSGEFDHDARPTTDDAPFFWHFTPYDDVISNFSHPIRRGDAEIALGERVLLLLLVVAVVLAAIFLLLPFVAVRSIWRGFPRKPRSALYFASIGLGFIFFEITLIQRLTLFLGYPTYSLTVTLASILIFTGVGAFLSSR